MNSSAIISCYPPPILSNGHLPPLSSTCHLTLPSPPPHALHMFQQVLNTRRAHESTYPTELQTTCTNSNPFLAGQSTSTHDTSLWIVQSSVLCILLSILLGALGKSVTCAEQNHQAQSKETNILANSYRNLKRAHNYGQTGQHSFPTLNGLSQLSC